MVPHNTMEKWAWLVPASSVMIHIAHRRNLLEPFGVDGKPVKLHTASPTGPSAKEVLLKSTSINPSDCEEYTFKDMTINIWSVLEFLIDQNMQRDGTLGTTVTRSLRNVIRGYEFKAVMEERSPCRQKKSIIRNTSTG